MEFLAAFQYFWWAIPLALSGYCQVKGHKECVRAGKKLLEVLQTGENSPFVGKRLEDASASVLRASRWYVVSQVFFAIGALGSTWLIFSLMGMAIKHLLAGNILP